MTLSADGTTLYGTTPFGGASNHGVIFSYDIATGMYTDLFDFTGPTGSGSQGQLVLSGGILYGTAETGGASGHGVIFSYNIGTAAYADLFDFTGPTGSSPFGGVILSADGTTLYGTASTGGASNHGVIFSYNIGTTAYADLFDFTGPTGSAPEGKLLLIGNILYGMTPTGGASNHGVIFSYNIGTTAYADLFDFTGPTGSDPQAGLVPSADGSTLYGTAETGGATSMGVVFSYNVATSTYTELFNFTGATGAFVGLGPSCDLILSGNTLYGTTFNGGSSNRGVLFSYDTVANTYSVLVKFTGTGAFPGATPRAGVILSGTTLYGTTEAGGAIGDGVVFSYNTASGGYAGKKKKKGPRPSHHPRPAPTRTPKYKHK